MLVLLVMFILTSVPVMTHAVKIDLPQRTSVPDEASRRAWSIWRSTSMAQ